MGAGRICCIAGALGPHWEPSSNRDIRGLFLGGAFYLRSDAESRLYIGDHQVVQGKSNENTTYDGDILLKAGKHPIRVEYVNDFARAVLQVSWQGPDFEKKEIGKDSLSREP